ncbi:MAG TPA: response regulator [Gillisia sp.]|nr:response regulator [Gillisia sp.]
MELIKSILIIEDDPALRENTKELLELSNFKIICAENGKQGIEQAIEYLPDLILCDILMPVMDGYKVLEYLSNNPHTKNIPFLFISAKSDLAEIRMGMNLGADDYITKPFNENELINAINKRINKFESIKRSWNKEPKTTIQNLKITSLEEFKKLVQLKGEKFRFQKRHTIYYEDDNSNFVYLLERGIVKTVKIDYEGKELITGLYREGNLFGLTSFKSNSYYDETAVTLNNVLGYRFSSKNFREIINNNPELILEIAEVLSNNLSTLKEHLLEMAYSSVLKKTTQTILQFAQKIPEDPQKITNITRNELAHIAGISTESFIRGLSQLRKKKIIEIEGRDIRILDFDQLTKIQ